MKEIEIIIDANGEVSIDMIGYKGKGCSVDSEALAKAMGITKKKNTKCEYYQQNTQSKGENRIKNRL